MNTLSAHRRRIAGAAAALDSMTAPPPPDDPQGARIRALARILRDLPRPPAPPELRSPAFLEEIFDSATRASASAIGAPLLRAAFEPAVPARDVAWVPVDHSRVGHLILRAPAPRTPGWLWARIRSDLEAARPTKAWRGWAWIAAAAAVILLGFLAGYDGTPRPPELVFQSVDRPLTLVGHPSDLIRELGR